MTYKICLIGLGYVGLPLAVAFAKAGFDVTGYDLKKERVAQLKKNYDYNEDISTEELKNVKITYTTDAKEIKKCNFIIVTVPTPVTKANVPNLKPLKSASEIIGKNLQKGSIVVFESTVYPSVTEEICAPIIEKFSGLKCGKDFKIGYSPERINPGDREHTVDKVVKVVSGMDKESTEKIAAVYGKAIKAGIFKAANIKTAEAAKVIENTQRDLNIALMNELSLIFEKIGINTREVLDAAGTKWNFHKYFPGLVGGHCIGVDPYYLTYKAEELGYHPQVILAGRKINDYMSEHIANMAIKMLNDCEKLPKKSKVLIMGLTFKENVKDLRNSRIKFTIKHLKDYGVDVVGCEPMVEDEVVEKEFGIKNIKFVDAKGFDGIILSFMHNAFKCITLDDLKKATSDKAFLIDIKANFKHEEAEKKGFLYKNL